MGILDSETDYANNLLDYLNRKKDFLLEVVIFTRIESLLSYTDYKKIDILLISEDMYSLIDGNNNIQSIFILTEHSYIKEFGENLSIYKYQSVEVILQEVLDLYSSQTETTSLFHYKMDCGKMNIIGVFSPTGGNYKTTFSFALGQVLAQEKQVLYLNFEPISGHHYIMDRGERGGMSDIIYYISQGKSNVSLKLKSLVQKIGKLDYLFPVDYYTDLYEMESGIMKFLIEELRRSGQYNIIILDIGFIGRLTMELLKLCEKVYMPTSNGKLAKGKEKEMKKILEEEDVITEFIPICIPVDMDIVGQEYEAENITQGKLGSFIRQIEGLI